MTSWRRSVTVHFTPRPEIPLTVKSDEGKLILIVRGQRLELDPTDDDQWEVIKAVRRATSEAKNFRKAERTSG